MPHSRTIATTSPDPKVKEHREMLEKANQEKYGVAILWYQDKIEQGLRKARKLMSFRRH